MSSSSPQNSKAKFSKLALTCFVIYIYTFDSSRCTRNELKQVLLLTKWPRHTSWWWGYWPLWWWWWPAPGPSSVPGRRRRRGLSTMGAGPTWGQCCWLTMTSATLSCLRSESNVLKWSSLNTPCEISFCYFFRKRENQCKNRFMEVRELYS